jgi:hypothetical protein
MASGQCIRALASWLLIGAGFYIYEIAGLVSAAIPFFFAALLRGDRDKQFVQKRLRQRGPWQTGTIVYLVVLLMVVLIWPRLFYEASGTVLAVAIGLPVAGMALANDLATCMRGQ